MSGRVAHAPKTRVKISFTNEGFDLMDREAKRHGWSPSDAINYMLSELDDWRNGRRRFVNVARQSRAAHAVQSSSAMRR